MTRKQYINKGQQLIIAVYNHPESFMKGRKLGDCLKTFRDNAKRVPAKFGSYEAAWNSGAMRWAREHYGVG
jgi:hypothetical protein